MRANLNFGENQARNTAFFEIEKSEEKKPIVEHRKKQHEVYERMDSWEESNWQETKAATITYLRQLNTKHIIILCFPLHLQ